MKRILLITSLFAEVAAAQPAPPPESAPLSAAAEMGQPGHLAIDGAFILAFQHDSASPPQGSSQSKTTIGVIPSADYFIAPNLSIGGQLEFLRSDTPSAMSSTTTITALGIGPRIG